MPPACTVDERGFIPVDRQMRTNVPHIFAIGDIVGQPMLAHKATHEGKVAAEVAAGEKRAFDARVDPVGRLHGPRGRLGRAYRNRGQGEGHELRARRLFPWVASGRSLALGSRRGLHEAPVRSGHAPGHRRRHRRPERGRPDLGGRARDRDGRDACRHRPDRSIRTRRCPRPSRSPPRRSKAR